MTTKPDRKRVKITPRPEGDGRGYSVEIDGTDIADLIGEMTVYLRPGKPPLALTQLLIVDAEVREAEIVLDATTVVFLERLGWKRPSA